MVLAFSSAASLTNAAAASPAACEASFKAILVESFSFNKSSEVYVLKFDVGAGFVRVVKGRIFMADRDSVGNVTSVEVFHDRGTGTYAASDIFYPINWPSQSQRRHQWRKVQGPNGYTPVQLIAADRDGVRFIGRTEHGDLKFYQAHELFPLASSNR